MCRLCGRTTVLGITNPTARDGGKFPGKPGLRTKTRHCQMTKVLNVKRRFSTGGSRRPDRKSRTKKIRAKRQLLIWFSLLVVLAIASVSIVVFSRKETRKPKEAKTFYESLPGIQLADLTKEQRHIAIEEMNKEACPCGCRYTVAQCRHVDTACRTSVRIGQLIVDRVRLQNE